MPKFTVYVKGNVDFEVQGVVADDFDLARKVIEEDKEMVKRLQKTKSFNDYTLEVYGVIKTDV